MPIYLFVIFLLLTVVILFLLFMVRMGRIKIASLSDMDSSNKEIIGQHISDKNLLKYEAKERELKIVELEKENQYFEKTFKRNSRETANIWTKVERLNRSQKRTIEELKLNQELINAISRQDTVSKLMDLGYGHLANDYKFDYAWFSMIDFGKRTIDGYCGEDIAGESKYSIDERKKKDEKQDILLKLVQSEFDKPIYVIGRHVLENEVGITFDNLNPKVFEKFRHDKLARVFIPILYRKMDNENEELDLIIGVLEAGFKDDKISEFDENQAKKFRREKFESQKINNLFIYVDNFGQVYYKNYLKERKEEIRKNITDENLHNQKQFVDKCLRKFMKSMSINFGNFSLLDMNTPVQTLSEQDVRVGYKDLDLKAINADLLAKYEKRDFKDLCGKVLHANPPKTIVNNDVLNKDSDIPYNPINADIRSEIGVPIISQQEHVMGIIIFSSKKVQFFNSIHKVLIEFFVKELGIRYLTSKRYASIKGLNQPVNFFSHSDKVVESMIEQVQDYFHCDNILTWSRQDTSDATSQYNLIHSTNPNYKRNSLHFSDTINSPHHFGEKINLGYQKNDDKIVLVRDAKKEINHQEILQIIHDQNFKSLVVIRIPWNKRYKYFITLFSKKKLNQEGVNEFASEFVLSLREKFENYLQLHSFIDILSNYELDDEDNLLRLLANKFYGLLNPSVLGLIPIGANNELDYSRKCIVGEKWDEHGDEKVLMADHILKSGTQFFETKTKYQAYLRKKGIELERTDFLIKAKIKSIAAIRLTHKESVQGVLMVEYGKNKIFDRTDKKLLESIGKLVANVMYRDTGTKRILKRLEEHADILEQKKKEAEAETDLLKEQQKDTKLEIEKLNRVTMDLKIQGASAAYIDIFGIMSHEIYNYFTQLSDKVSDHNLKTKKSIKSTMQTISDLLDLFNTGNESKEFIDVNESIKKLVRTIVESKLQTNIELNLATYLPQLSWNRAEFNIIIYNLINNAVYELDQFKKRSKKIIKISTAYLDKTFIISVWDNGPGIRENIKEKIFDAHFTTKKGGDGHGLGLYYIKTALERAFEDQEGVKATIDCESSRHVYTKFTIKIPKTK